MQLKTGTDLKNIQHDFLTSVNQDSNELETHILGSDHLTTEALTTLARIDIYRNNTQQARVRALTDIYPITRDILGAQFFQQVGAFFSQHQPADHWNLNHYGKDFPQFIAEYLVSNTPQQDLPYLNDFGQMEWLLHCAYYVADADQFPIEAFNQLTPTEQESCRLQLAPSVALLSSRWPIYSLWQHWQQGELPETVEAIIEPEYLCIYRADYQPTVSVINTGVYLLLDHCQRMTLAQLAESPELSDALHLLAQCIEQGWITGFYFSESPGHLSV